MSNPDNLRIHFYGVQGSGSIFPPLAERRQQREYSDAELLELVFKDLAERAGTDGKLNLSVEEIIGGALNRRNVVAYRNRFAPEEPLVFGGWTTCVRIETADGDDIVFDCGSGFRVCAGHLVAKWNAQELQERHLHIFGSHSHYDHTEGFDQAAVCFDPRNNIHIYSNRQYLQALDQNLGIFSKNIDVNLKGVATPPSYELMPASFTSTEIRDLEREPPPAQADPMIGDYHHIGDPMHFGETTVQPIEVFHPSPCYAYRVDRGGKSFVFCTDHELRRGPDPADPLQVASLEAEERLRSYCQDIDLLYRDGQFLEIEYDGHQGIGSPMGVSRLDWGHSTMEDVMDMATQCNIKHCLIGHHDPNRDWSEREWIDSILTRKSQQTGLKFELARAETVIDL